MGPLNFPAISKQAAVAAKCSYAGDPSGAERLPNDSGSNRNRCLPPGGGAVPLSVSFMW
jgi:hypothetical protein